MTEARTSPETATLADLLDDCISVETWKADNRCRVFSRDEVMQIRAEPLQRSLNEWAKHFGVNIAVIKRIRTGQSYKEFPADSSGVRALEKEKR